MFTSSFNWRGCSPATPSPLLGARLTLRRRHYNLQDEALDSTELAVEQLCTCRQTVDAIKDNTRTVHGDVTGHMEEIRKSFEK